MSDDSRGREIERDRQQAIVGELQGLDQTRALVRDAKGPGASGMRPGLATVIGLALMSDMGRAVHAGPSREKALRPSSPRERLGVGRNDPCPCGSGRKWKRCCLSMNDGRDSLAVVEP
jgi:hypothetical protein